MIPPKVRAELEQIFRAALEAVAPEHLIARALDGAQPVTPSIAEARGIYLFAVGKAALGMAIALERVAVPKLRKGIAVVPKGTASQAAGSTARIELLEASHPIP